MDAAVVLERTGLVEGKAVGSPGSNITAGRAANITQVVNDGVCCAIVVGPGDRAALGDCYLGWREHHVFDFYGASSRRLILA